MPYDLIIFDCDGTLVDSERFFSAITSRLLNEAGWNEYTPELCQQLFTGLDWATIKAILEEKHQQKIPELQ